VGFVRESERLTEKITHGGAGLAGAEGGAFFERTNEKESQYLYERV